MRHISEMTTIVILKAMQKGISESERKRPRQWIRRKKQKNRPLIKIIKSGGPSW